MEAKRVSREAKPSTVVVDVQSDVTDPYSQLNEDILEECGNSITDSDSNSSIVHTVVVVDQSNGTLDRTKQTIPQADADDLVQSVKTLTTQIKALTDNTKQLALEGLSLRNELERVADQVDQAEKSDELTQLLAVEKLKKQFTFDPGRGSEPKRKGQGDQPSGSNMDNAIELQERKSPELALSANPSPVSTLKKCEARTPDTQRLTNLPSRPPVKLEFEDITYSVQVGGSCCKRRKGEKLKPDNSFLNTTLLKILNQIDPGGSQLGRHCSGSRVSWNGVKVMQNKLIKTQFQVTSDLLSVIF